MEAAIHNPATQYRRTSEAGISGRDTERAAFNLVNRELATHTEGTARVRALGRNHALWSILVKDLALAENQLPDALKAELIGLGLWSMRYSTLAIAKALPAEPLIEVNRNVVEGLTAQGAIGGQQTSTVLTASLSI